MKRTSTKRTRMIDNTLRRLLAAVFVTGVGMLPATAQTAEAQSGDEEGPGRGVARISLMNGEVSVKRGDSGDLTAAALNAPLLAEDRIYTGAGSRAEVQFDYYHRIRLAPDSEVRLAELEYRRYQIQVARGTVTFSAIKGGDAQVEISTPAASVRPMAHGRYRITVGPDGTAEITVRDGEAEIFTPRGTQKLREGRTMMVRNDAGDGPQFQVVAELRKDAWDEFNEERDKDLRRGASVYQYVSRDIYGAEDLHGNGNWTWVDPYGWCWRPYAAVDWAPYRHGRWSWLDYYGWSWVSYDPWGWAPYHYGRWFHHGGGWFWHPGATFGVRHHWSPALVGWLGWSSWGGVSVGVGWGGFGHWGWVPLAPFEPCYRWWGPRYYGGYRNVNRIHNNIQIVNNTNITNIYRNSRVRNSVSVVNGNDFSRGYTGRALRASEGDLSRASAVRGSLPVAPSRESLRFADREVRAGEATRGQSAAGDRFYSRREPARIERVPFDEQRRALETVGRRSYSEGRGVEARGTDARGADVRSAGVRSEVARPDGAARSAEPAGVRGTNDVDRGAGARRGERAETSTGGWRTFGSARADVDARRDAGSTLGGLRSREAAGSPNRGGDVTVTPRSSMENRGGWSTGRAEANRNETSRGEARGEPATRIDRGGWSTGRGESAPRVESPRSESPRSESPRWEAPRMDRGGWSTGRSESVGGAAPRMERAPRTESPRYESPRSEAPRYEAPRYEAPRYEAPRNESPRYEAPRSSPPSFGGGGGGNRSMDRAPSFGGGGSSPRMSGGDMGGGGGMRSGGGGGFGGGGGAARSGGGGGGSRGGRDR